MDWTWGWTAVEALATGVATLVLIGGIGFVLSQIREARKSTNAQIAMDLFRELRGKENVEKVSDIYKLKPDDVKNLPSTAKDSIDYILDRLGILGALINNGILDEKLAIEAFGGVTVLKCWYQLKDYIEEVRKRRGSQWCANVEDFAYRALKHWGKYPPRWILFFSELERPDDLVEKLSTNELRPRCLKEQVREVMELEGESKRGEASLT